MTFYFRQFLDPPNVPNAVVHDLPNVVVVHVAETAKGNLVLSFDLTFRILETPVIKIPVVVDREAVRHVVVVQGKLDVLGSILNFKNCCKDFKLQPFFQITKTLFNRLYHSR